MKTSKWILIKEHSDYNVYYFVLSNGGEGYYVEQK